MSDTLHIVSSSGSTQTVDITVADVWDITLTANCTLTLTGASVGSAFTLALFLRQDGTGGRTVTWPGSVTWPAGTAPTLHAGAAAVTLITLTSVDGGSTWIGFAEPSDGAAGATGATGAAGTNGTNGTNGTLGGGVSIPYTFSTTTTDSDPGNGNLRLSNATQNLATVIRADLLSSDGTDWSAILATLADSTNTSKGYIRLFKANDATKWIVFAVSAVASPSGYKNITVSVVGSSASSPFSNGDAISLEFTRTGDAGSAGTSPLTTKGDIWVYSSVDARLPVGSDTQVLSADSTQTTGLKWVAAASSSGGVLAVVHNTTGGTKSTTSATQADVDATNATITFTAPASGKVLVRVMATINITAGVNNAFFGIRESTTDVVTKDVVAQGISGASIQLLLNWTAYITGISAGSHTYKLAFAMNGGATFSVFQAATVPLHLEVWPA